MSEDSNRSSPAGLLHPNGPDSPEEKRAVVVVGGGGGEENGGNALYPGGVGGGVAKLKGGGRENSKSSNGYTKLAPNDEYILAGETLLEYCSVYNCT